MKNQHCPTIGHKLRHDEGNQEENESHRIGVPVNELHKGRNMAAYEFTGTRYTKRPAIAWNPQSKGAC